MEEITIPGTNTKIPVVGALAAALVIAVIVILRKSGDESEQAGDVSGLLAAELDQRLREQWEATVNLIAEAMEEVGQSDPTSPPAAPVEPKPKPKPKPPSPDGESYKDFSDSPLKIVFNEVIVGGPVKVGQSNPVSAPTTSIKPKISYTSSESYNETVGGLPKVVYAESSSVGEVGQSDPVSAPVTSIKPKMPTLHAGGASLYTLGSYDLL
jgi:hypothetical protein